MLRRSFFPLAASLALTGCASTYLGRYVQLRSPDVQDWQHLPRRVVAAGAAPRPLPAAHAADESAWQQALAGCGLPTSAEALGAWLAARSTTSLVVLYQGHLVHQFHGPGWSAKSLHKSFSMSKSVLSALVGVAEADGLLKVTDRVGDHLTGLADERVAGLALIHLLNCTAGFAYQRGVSPWADQVRMYYTTDVRRLVRQARLAHEPGARFVEEDFSPLLLGVVLEAALQRRDAQDTLSAFASRRLWQPLGAEADAWWVMDAAGPGLEKTESGLVARSRDLARFGQLFLDGGAVAAQQLVPAPWVAACGSPPRGSASHFTDGYHHRLWWGAMRPGMRQHDYFANGHFGQRIYLCPDKQLVLVRLGTATGEVAWTDQLMRLAQAWPERG
jgi:CubicO group peptidase (beta-lactamase class C family)